MAANSEVDSPKHRILSAQEPSVTSQSCGIFYWNCILYMFDCIVCVYMHMKARSKETLRKLGFYLAQICLSVCLDLAVR